MTAPEYHRLRALGLSVGEIWRAIEVSWPWVMMEKNK